jgi:hypothetical protein
MSLRFAQRPGGRVAIGSLAVIERGFSDSNQSEETRMGQGLGVVVALCAAGWFASIVFTMVALKTVDGEKHENRDNWRQRSRRKKTREHP